MILLEPLLEWNRRAPSWEDAQIGTPDDGVYFTLSHHPTCYRRGPYRLLIEICGGPNHHKWGCFDEADQPCRYFHWEDTAKREAEEIARVLLRDRGKVWSVISSNSLSIPTGVLDAKETPGE